MIDPETADAIATGPMQFGPPLECDLDDEGTPIAGRDAALYAELSAPCRCVYPHVCSCPQLKLPDARWTT